MNRPNYLLIDGTPPGEDELKTIFAMLHDTLAESGANIKILELRSIKLGHCVGCFGCWLKTPGLCVRPDSGREIVQAILSSDCVFLFGPILFGTYAPDLKRLLDRCLSSLNLPYLQVSRGETHHLPRYDRYPRLVSIGIQKKPDSDESALFKLIAGRNAIQFHAPSFASSAITISDSAEVLRMEFQSLLSRIDAVPKLGTLKKQLQHVNGAPEKMTTLSSGQNALLLIGSPKAKRSTSAALGGYLMGRLETYGWHTATSKLDALLREPVTQAEILNTFRQSDLIVLASPLYNDSLPYPVIYAMQLIKAQRFALNGSNLQRLVVIVNNGFPEPQHNLPAIEICSRFARECGLDWAGGFIVGGGEALSAGQPLPEIKRTLPPVRHLMRAIDLAAKNLAEGKVVPEEAERMISRNPIFPAPFSVYRWIYQRVAARRWEQEAAKNGLVPAMLRAQPYHVIAGK